MYRRIRLLIGIVLLLVLLLAGSVACANEEDLSTATQDTPMGTVRVWVNALNNRSITGVASCIYDIDTPEYSAFVQLYATSYPAFEQSAVVAIVDYEELSINQAYAKYDLTLNVKREVATTIGNGIDSETMTAVDQPTSTFYFKKTAKNLWVFTSEPNPVAGNDPGDDFVLDTEDLATIDVNFVTNGGSSVEKLQVKEGNKIITPTPPTRQGYTFAGWYTGQSYLEQWDFDTSVTADDTAITLYAKWHKEDVSTDATLKAADFKIDEWDFSNSDPRVVNVTVSKAENTAVTNFSFSTSIVFTTMTPDHWGVYLDRNGSSASPKIIALTPGETTTVYVILTAQDGSTTNIYEFNLYLKRDYTITYVEDDVPIEGVAPLTVEEGSTIGSFPSVTKDGYYLVGWSCEGKELNENSIVDSDMIVTPEWEAKYVDVTLQWNGGALEDGKQFSTVRLTYGDPIGTEVGKPTKIGYAFKYWQRNGQAVTDNTGKLLAVWDLYDLDTPTFQAIYEEEVYNITYIGVEGVEFTRLETYRYGQYSNSYYILPTNLTRAGSVFVEWQRRLPDNTYVKIERIDNTVSGNLEIRAIWTDGSYNITYKTFDSSQCDYDSQDIVWVELPEYSTQKKYKDTLDMPVITSTGLSFAGWYLDEAFEERLTSSYHPSEDTIVYARWTERYTEGLNFSLKEDKYVVKQYTGTSTTVIIPSTYLTIPVVEIAPFAFKSTNISGVDFSAASNLQVIGGGAFENCTELLEINIPANITYIGDGILSGCAKLSKVYIDTWDNQAANNLGRLFGTVEPVAFNDYDEAEQMISASMTVAYYVPKSLKEIHIKSTNITQGFAQGMASVTSITIDGVKSSTIVDLYAFKGCVSLTDINLPSSITVISKEAFMDCMSLSDLVLPVDVVSIGQRAFSGVSATIVLPERLATLGDNAMQGYKGTNFDLRNVNIIGKECFMLASNLVSIDLSSIHTIGEGAFKDCKSLASVSLSMTLEKLNNWTFSGCASLAGITVSASTTVSSNALDSTCNVTVR